jgi:hypothetical protein
LGGSKSFEIRYDFLQPSSGGGFRFFEGSEAIVRIDGEASLVQRDVPARKLFPETIRGNE